MSRKNRKDSPRDVAIIGMSGRFPGAHNIDEFWQDLCAGVESISFFSQQELLSSGVDSAEFNDPNYVNAGSVLDDIDLFDARFFGFSPREAEAMDPQQRLFLECAEHALEDSGYNTDTYPGTVGVYAGCAMSTYIVELYRNPKFVELVGPVQVLIGNDKDYLTTHVSYKLNLTGPSLSVQTTCSTSLVAVGLACESLRNRQCDMALAGGVCIRVPQKVGYYYEPGGIFTPDGHCRVFDAKAAGAVFGNGVGIVVLKRLEDALADGDCIDAVIKGWAINNDGSSKISYTAPSVEGQTEVIRMAQRAAGVRTETITYVEAHGTATTLGDPIEVAALRRAFEMDTDKKGFCAIGSVKTNVGHLDHAAGVAGLVKTVLSLKHKQIPPSLHFESPNPEIDFENSPFYVNTKLSEWKTNGHPPRAGVSAFGIGGTNVHVVLEEAPAVEDRSSSRPAHLLLMSAKSESSLEVLTDDMIEKLSQNPDLHPADVAYTSQVGRRAYDYRRALVFSDGEGDAVRALEALDPRRVFTSRRAPKERPVVFMFPGQGAQYLNMAAELYRAEPSFREDVDSCMEVVRSHLELDLRQVLYPAGDQSKDASKQLNQTAMTQLALFVIEHSLAKLWMRWGVNPDAMIGHSLGEYVAACLAGVYTLEDALALVAVRGRLMQKRPKGAMLVVALSEKEVQPMLGPKLSLAAVNGRSLCVVSGTIQSINGLRTRLERRGVNCTRLHTSHAFHSPMMDPVLEPFRDCVQKVALKPPKIPYISNVTGTWIEDDESTDPAYWSRHLRQTVRFARGVEELLKEPDRIFLEVGPGRQLGSLLAQNSPKHKSELVLASLPHPLERSSDTEFLLRTLAHLWISGTEINWHRFHEHERRRRVHLPPYPFERERFWVESPDDTVSPQVDLARIKRPNLDSWFYVPSWEYSIAPDLAEPDRTRRQTRWLVFADDCGVADSVVSSLQAYKQEVVVVGLAERFAKDSDHQFRIKPNEKEHYKALLKELRLVGRLPERVVHCWSVSENEHTETTPTSFQRAQDLGFYSLLYLTQALIARRTRSSIQVAVITNDVHLVNGSEKLSPEKATVLGAGRSIPQEYPDIRFRNVDIGSLARGGRSSEIAADQIVAEILGDVSDSVVAYREGQRWVQTFEPAKLRGPYDPAAYLREGGTYLITGGLGNIGLALAEELAKLVRPRLILVGRSGFLKRKQWDDWVDSHPEDDPVSRKIRKIQAIERQSAEVLLLRGDVSSEKQMGHLLDQVYETSGVIHGVIHGAGTVAEDGFFSIDQADPGLCELHFAPKVRGVIVLEKLLRGKDIDFHLVISSLSSVLAGLGYLGYSAANIFMDTFASERSLETGVPWVSVNWDNWTFRDQSESGETEMALLPEEGVETFRRIMSSSWLTQVIVSVSDLQARFDQWINLEYFEGRDKPGRRFGHARPNLENPYIAPRNQMEQSVANLCREFLGLDRVSVYDNFFSDLSGTSLLATQLVSRLRTKLGIDLPLRRFFEGPTVAEIAKAIGSPDEEAVTNDALVSKA